MTRPTRLSLVLLITLAAGCRQPDGPLPVLDEEGVNRMTDLGGDLRALVRGEAGAKGSFASDLAVFVDSSDSSHPVVLSFGQKIEEAIVSAQFTDETAEQLARTAWMVVDGTELSERQIKNLQADFRTQLIGVGVPEPVADAVSAEVPVVQRAVTTRPRRWYEVL